MENEQKRQLTVTSVRKLQRAKSHLKKEFTMTQVLRCLTIIIAIKIRNQGMSELKRGKKNSLI
jgi:hypothetical protein